METQNFLPENDQDLQLALEVGVTLDSGENISFIQDPLIQSLLTFKDQEQQEIAALKDISNEIWYQIAKDTQSTKKANITPITTRRTNTWAWSTAATVLLAAFLGIFWFTSLDRQTIIAQSDSTIETITLADGSEIILRPHSTLYELAVSNTKRSYKLEGESFFKVAKDANRPFSVQANSGLVTVLGTQFNVSTWGNETNVFLEEGSVRLDLDNNEPVILSPGEQATISSTNISIPITTDVSEFKDWLNNTIVLKSTSITQVIAELEHHYKAVIDISDIENKSELITGTIPLNDFEETLNDLGTILGGTFRKVNSNSFVFIPLN